MWTNSEGSGETRSLAWGFAVRLCDKYHNLMSWLTCPFLLIHWRYYLNGPGSSLLIECPLRGTGGHGFDPRSRHTVSLNMVLAAPRLALKRTGGVRTGRPSVRIMWLGVYHVKCLGHDISVRQHYKREHWVERHRDMTEKLLKATLNPQKKKTDAVITLNVSKSWNRELATWQSQAISKENGKELEVIQDKQ